MARAHGHAAALLLRRETTYGQMPAGDWARMPFRKSTVGAEQGLIDDPILGLGRDTQAPLRDVIKAEGDITIPVDVRYLGFWLTGLMGDPVSAASAKAGGSVTFTGQPAANSTLTFNGSPWTFVAGGATGNETNIGGSLAATLAQLAADLNGSSDPEVAKATFAAGPASLSVEYDIAGVTGNAYTIAASSNPASHATVSGATLAGGRNRHLWTSGAAVLPSWSIETGLPEASRYAVCTGAVVNSVALNWERSGAAAATVAVIAQGETVFGASQGGTPASWGLAKFSQFQGSISRAGVPVANLTAANLTYANNLERVETIRDDGMIEGIDPGLVTLTGDITTRFANGGLLDDATAGNPVSLTYGYAIDAGTRLVVTVPQVHLPRPKLPVDGPGGISAQFKIQAAHDDAAGCLCTFELHNDLSGSTYQ